MLLVSSSCCSFGMPRRVPARSSPPGMSIAFPRLPPIPTAPFLSASAKAQLGLPLVVWRERRATGIPTRPQRCVFTPLSFCYLGGYHPPLLQAPAGIRTSASISISSSGLLRSLGGRSKVRSFDPPLASLCRVGPPRSRPSFHSHSWGITVQSWLFRPLPFCDR